MITVAHIPRHPLNGDLQGAIANQMLVTGRRLPRDQHPIFSRETQRASGPGDRIPRCKIEQSDFPIQANVPKGARPQIGDKAQSK